MSTDRSVPALAAAVALFGFCCTLPLHAEDDDPTIEDKPLSRLVKDLRSDNRGIQLRAAQALGKAPAELHPRIIPLLMPVLKSERENDKFVAAQALGLYGPAARVAIPELLPMLTGTQFERNRAAAAKAVGQILKDAAPSEEVEKAVQGLIAIFRDPYPDVQRESVNACGMIGPAAKSCIPKLVPPLEYNLRGGSQDQPYMLVRRATDYTLSRMGPLAAEYIDRLISQMHIEGGEAPEALEAIGCIGAVHPNVASNLVDFLEKGASRDWRHAPAAKMAGWKALEKFGPKAAVAVPLIVRFLKMDRGTEEPPALVIQWFAVLRAVGPAAQEAVPVVQNYCSPKTIPGGWRNSAEELGKEALKTVEALGAKK